MAFWNCTARSSHGRCGIALGGVLAITFGHVVLGRDRESLSMTRAHERVHVRQYEMWGPAFIPAYLAATAYAVASGHDGYRDNVFEREAARGSGQQTAFFDSEI
jgi:hypothetical protein